MYTYINSVGLDLLIKNDNHSRRIGTVNEITTLLIFIVLSCEQSRIYCWLMVKKKKNKIIIIITSSLNPTKKVSLFDSNSHLI